MNEHINYLNTIMSKCENCHACKCPYEHITSSKKLPFGPLAKELLTAQFNQALKDVVFGCNQCGLCLKDCPQKFDAKEFIFHARGLIEQKEPTYECQYNKVRIDQEVNLFTQLKKAHGVTYEEQLDSDDDCSRLFLPSCHLWAKFPTLTKKTMTYLKDLDIADGMTTYCCGQPLYAAGLEEAFNQYSQMFSEKIKSHGVEEIITPCPNCYQFLLRLIKLGKLPTIKIKCLSEELLKKGVYIQKLADSPINTLSFHDSCPDRKWGIFAKSVRALFSDFHMVELPHCKENTLCCGGGGLVGPYKLALQSQAKLKKIEDCQAVQTDAIITTCFNCLDTLHQDIPIHHYLEMLIEPVDYQKYLEVKGKC